VSIAPFKTDLGPVGLAAIRVAAKLAIDVVSMLVDLEELIPSSSAQSSAVAPGAAAAPQLFSPAKEEDLSPLTLAMNSISDVLCAVGSSQFNCAVAQGHSTFSLTSLPELAFPGLETGDGPRAVTCATRPLPFDVIALSPAAVDGVWAGAALEHVFCGSDDEERFSVQALPSFARNLLVEAMPEPLGYALMHTLVTVPVPDL
jgi:hypothetical protein